MIIRLWVTGLVPSRVNEYDEFANLRSLRMFKSLDGCLGVTFLRSSERGYVVSFWRDMSSVDALETSALYKATVADILAAGFLSDPQTVEILDATGGFLTPYVLKAFSKLEI
jgi:heme-degrading monooxygenase HmoA